MAWALMDLVSNYQFRKQFPDVTPQYWGSHAQYFTKFWSLQEANQGEHKKDAIKMWQYRTPTNNSPSDPVPMDQLPEHTHGYKPKLDLTM